MAVEDIPAQMTGFLEDNFLWILLVFGMIMAFIIIYKKVRSIPNKPDYIKIFHDRSIKDESLNKRNKYDPLWIFRGDQRIGKIVSIDTKKYKHDPIKDEYKAGLKQEFEIEITTIVFKINSFLKFFWYGKRILRFITTEAEIKGNKVLFDSTVGFTALGMEYTTKTSYPETSAIVDSHYSKRLFEANVNVMAGKMESISAEDPAYAHELTLKRLEIERIRAEKEKKVGQMI